MTLRTALTTLAAGLVLVGCDNTGLEVTDLEGSWVADVYEYTDNANGLNVVDVIQRDGASFTLTVDASGTASTLFTDGLGGSSSDSGTLNSSSTTLTLAGDVFLAVRNGNVLTLTDQDSSFDFGGGSTSATLRVVMHRN